MMQETEQERELFSVTIDTQWTDSSKSASEFPVSFARQVAKIHSAVTRVPWVLIPISQVGCRAEK